MGSHIIRVTVFAAFLSLAAAAQAQVCVKINEPHDTLSPSDRTAAVLLLNRQFTLAGEQVVEGCPDPYLLAHIKLGNSIVVLLTGPLGHREGTALGLDDLPALYNQMVRSLVTGRPMEGMANIDRENVTRAQATAQRVYSDAFTYARLGYGGVFAQQAHGAPSFGFGYRAELDKVAIDVSFLNFMGLDTDYRVDAVSVGNTSLVKLSGLYLLRRQANSTPYVGGGLSWGRTYFNQTVPVQSPPLRNGTTTTYYSTSSSAGSGLQGELSAGYELGRATTIRMFIQGDAILPFYTVRTETFSSRGGLVSSTNRWMPSFVVSMGLGWQRNRK
jgi:hypothetical protein